jgi:hypothetical protein
MGFLDAFKAGVGAIPQRRRPNGSSGRRGRFGQVAEL